MNILLVANKSDKNCLRRLRRYITDGKISVLLEEVTTIEEILHKCKRENADAIVLAQPKLIRN